VDSSEQGEHSGSGKCMGFLDELNICYLPKRGFSFRNRFKMNVRLFILFFTSLVNKAVDYIHTLGVIHFHVRVSSVKSLTIHTQY
jgi:hypothetical protein